MMAAALLSPSPLWRGRLLTNASLAEYVYFKVGGPADYIYLPADLLDLQQFIKDIPRDMPITFLGFGSNVLVRDKGVEGVVIITQVMKHDIKCLDNHIVRAEAGVSSPQLARYTARQSLAGIEFLAGIPGTIGGALAMNAGCHDSETWKHVDSVEMMNRHGEIIKRSAAEFEVDYRHVKRGADEWFVAGYFKLAPGDKAASLEKIRVLLERRAATQPTGTANCGSVFRNPYPQYAGQLIEAAGLKGKRIGGAHVSEKHANFIINDDHATARDIENLIFDVRARIFEKTGILLVTEVCIIGRE